MVCQFVTENGVNTSATCRSKWRCNKGLKVHVHGHKYIYVAHAQ